MITAYDYFSAQFVEIADLDAILVGDSLGMVIKGEKDTLGVRFEELLYHLKAVRRGAKDIFIVADMPFLTYGINDAETIKYAGTLLREGADAVKIEGPHYELIKKMLSVGIPVMGHLGLTPQWYKIFGNFRPRGKKQKEKKWLIDSAKKLESSGVFSIVLECIPEELAKEITDMLTIPTIGIGAGRYTDGQILVWHDVLGYNEEFSPYFVKKYCNLKEIIVQSLKKYNYEVKNGIFPEEKHSFLKRE